MTDTQDAVRTSALATGLATFAGLVGGPVLAAVVGFAAGLPFPLIFAASLAAVIWLSPVTGVWLLVIAAVAVIAFIFGSIRKPPSGLFRLTTPGHLAAHEQIASLQRQLAAARAREHALAVALAHAHTPHRPPAVLPAPIVRGQVTTEAT
jgi:hypothetical protein